jgi:hypothetical protein
MSPSIVHYMSNEVKTYVYLSLNLDTLGIW